MKNKTYTRIGSLLLAAALSLSLLAGCGGSNTPAATDEPKEEAAAPAAEENPAATDEPAEPDDAATEESDTPSEPTGELHTAHFDYLLQSGEGTTFYDDYNENPIAQWWMEKEWNVDGERWQVDVDFLTLPAGSETDTMTTLYATGEYYDVMPMAYTSETVGSLYDSGVIIDLTEYVNKYMPNYLQWGEDHPEYKHRMTNHLDGEDRYVQLYALNNAPEDPFCGWAYRRDWIVKYGKNPKTGAAFSGGYVDAEKTDWEDDVVFPSGNEDPVYISDWEWMFDIFMTALEEENLPDGYAFQLYYAGDDSMGTLTSTFTNGNSYYYMDKDGVAQCGLTSDGYRTYIECMREWYKKGWTNQNFEENSADRLFWNVDTTAIYQARVGMFYTGTGQLGNTTATDSQPDVCVYGAAYPINDVYGDESMQNYVPDVYYGNSMLGATYVITNRMDTETLPALLTALDYFYSHEGALHRTFGFTKEELAERDVPFYHEWGLDDGAYYVEERDGEEWYVRNPLAWKTDNLNNACSMIRVAGDGIRKNVDSGYKPVNAHAIQQYQLHPNSGMIASDITSQLTPDQAQETAANTNNIRTYVSMHVPDFITGRTDIADDAAWDEFCRGIEDYNPQLYCDYINAALGNN